MVFRQCCITRKKLPRTELFRLVRTNQGEIFFDPTYTIAGRGIHFSRDPKIVAVFFDPKKHGMIRHFLKTSLHSDTMAALRQEVEEFCTI